MRAIVSCAVFALLALLPATMSAVHAEELSGTATIVDGDTLTVSGTRVRLFGLDAPESDQTCHDDDGKLYRCGQKAADALADFIVGKTLRCLPAEIDQEGQPAAICSADGVDLGDWLVRSGLALDWPQYSRGKYASAQKIAEHTGDGLWGGQWVAPWRYRECIRAGGKPSGCSENALAR
jgi:endonuclease YncB( thermonuclease family)